MVCLMCSRKAVTCVYLSPCMRQALLQSAPRASLGSISWSEKHSAVRNLFRAVSACVKHSYSCSEGLCSALAVARW